MDSEDEDQMQIREGSKLLKTDIKGDIKLEDISFKYESRQTSLFEGFDF
jgi:ABC-type bacteriocin/lantibiotic exporter with double-glycine peptidase domain